MRLIVLVCLTALLFSSCSNQEIENELILEPDSSTEMKHEKANKPPVLELTSEQVDSLNKTRRDSLIKKYSAFSLRDTTFKFTYQLQSFFDTSKLFALNRYEVQDIIQQNDQMMLIFGPTGATLSFVDYYYSSKNPNKYFMRISIPSELFNTRGKEFHEKCLSGCFIVKIENTFSTVTQQIEAELTDFETSGFGELEYYNTTIETHAEPTIFIYGDLIDFYLDESGKQ